jgi:enterochelin esterase-like enzyme
MSLRTTYTLAVATMMLATFSVTVNAAPDDIPVAQPPVGKYVKLLIFTNLVRPLKPQDNEREIDVYLPAAYVSDTSKLLRFPVIYLLHGSPGIPNDFNKNGHWPVFMELNTASTSLGPAILVAPDGNFTGAAFGDSEWLNSADGQDRYEDFLVDQVVPYIDAHFRTVAAPVDRTICGVSEGGFGAVNIALHRPGVFGYVLACSGYYTNDGSGWARRTMGHDKTFLAFNSPLTFVNDPDNITKNLSLWQSEKFFIGSGIDENRYTIESREMAEALKSHKIPVVLYQVDGKHGWGLWNTLFVEGLESLFPLHPSVTANQQ